MAQEALDRWWWPSLMMFGPNDATSKHTAQSMRWKIKRFTNDELRQKFVDITVPQAEFLGLRVPDPDLRWDEATPALPLRRDRLDASSSRCCKGNGPCNRERLEARRARARGRALGARRGAAHTREKRQPARSQGSMTMTQQTKNRVAAVRSFHPCALGPRAQARRQHSRRRRDDGDRARARRLHAAAGRREHLGRALRATSSLRIRRTRTRCSSPRKTRCIGTRRSTTFPTRSRTCERAAPHCATCCGSRDTSLVLGAAARRMDRACARARRGPRRSPTSGSTCSGRRGSC